jgi:hypothetical protein
MSEWTDRQIEKEQCRLSRHPRACWKRLHRTNGAMHYAYECDLCGPITNQLYPEAKGWYVTKELARQLSGLDPDTFLLVECGLRYHLCARCGKTLPCDEHHIAPRKVFEDAETWPTTVLCQECHLEWHRILTPGLCTRYDPARHVEILSRWLKPPQLDALRHAIRTHLSLEVSA